uniref:SUN domain-containing protein 2-like n=1 Tax=Nicotiana sylvestris TaxID=4096 RepID=A0A1U7Y257_NICSY
MEMEPAKQHENNNNKEGTSTVERQAEPQSNNGKELEAVDNEDNDHVQVANKFAILQGMEEEKEPINQLAKVTDNAATSSTTIHNHASTKQKPKNMVNNEGKLNPAAQLFHLKASGISSTNGLVNGNEASKAKNDTAQWVERNFKNKTGERIVKINKPCQQIPSQDTLVNKVPNKTPNFQAEGSKSATFKERVQGCGGRLWDTQREYDSEENEVPQGAQNDEKPNEKDKEKDEQSVNGEHQANDNNTTEFTEIRNYKGRDPEVNDPGGTEDDQIQISQEDPQGHNATDKKKQSRHKTEILNITVTMEKNQLQLLKRGEEKALVPKRNAFGATSGSKEDNEEGEEPGKLGYDMDQESTTQHHMNAARQSDLSPSGKGKISSK